MANGKRRHKRLLTTEQYLRRLLRGVVIAAGVLCFSLGIGVLGYHYTENIPWVDSILNASMILTGMGPVDQMKTTTGKLFASAYALFSGVAFLTVAALLFAPTIHRFLHRFHLEIEPDEENKD